MGLSGHHCGQHYGHCFVEWLMLPEPQYDPAGATKGLVVEAVTLMSVPELGHPIVGVGCGDGTVFGASMPEAPIKVNDYFAPRKHDVRAGAAVGQPDEERLAETETLGV